MLLREQGNQEKLDAILGDKPPSTGLIDAEERKLKAERKLAADDLATAKTEYQNGRATEESLRAPRQRVVEIRQRQDLLEDERKGLEAAIRAFEANREKRINAVLDDAAGPLAEKAAKSGKRLAKALEEAQDAQRDLDLIEAEISRFFMVPTHTGLVVPHKSLQKAMKKVGISLGVTTIFSEILSVRTGSTLSRLKACLRAKDVETPKDERTNAQKRVDAARAKLSTLPRERRTWDAENGFVTIPAAPGRQEALDEVVAAEAELRREEIFLHEQAVKQQDAGREKARSRSRGVAA